MKFIIKHELKGRIRLHMVQSKMSYEQADTLLYYLQSLTEVSDAKVYERTADVTIFYSGSRERMITALKQFHYQDIKLPEGLLEHSGRELNAVYQRKLVQKLILRMGSKLFVPYPIRAVYAGFCSLHYFWKGMKSLAKGKLEVEVLDAAAIGVSILRRDFNTASSVMFLLGIGELLEQWTHKKSVGDLARSMSLNIKKVWMKQDGQEVLVAASKICPGDLVVVHMGTVIPFDGIVTEGEAMVNQASLTGESLPVRKEVDKYVYAGTVVEEGELTIQVKETSGSTRFEKIVTMIEDSEKLKSGVESKAERLADQLVPYTLAGTVLTWAVTRNTTKALTVLMVDFSCALKLAIPIAVLSAIREANARHITVKGGKYMEAMAEATTIVFDKTGTLTKAKPTVKDVIPFNGGTKEEMLRIAACLEEHFPHSMAKAVVVAAKQQGLAHEEMHSKVNYIVAHGISSYIEGRRVVIGSYHFVFEDEGCSVRPEYQERFSHLPEEYYSEVLPEDKASYIEKQKKHGDTVIMVGDGINDSPALSAANVGIAISDGAEIAREIADITIAADDLNEIVTLKKLSSALMQRIHKNYYTIIGINAALIALGVGGMVQPTTSALLHNTSTVAISLRNMENLLEQ